MSFVIIFTSFSRTIATFSKQEIYENRVTKMSFLGYPTISEKVCFKVLRKKNTGYKAIFQLTGGNVFSKF